MVHVIPEVMTDRSPYDWTTAASRSLFMDGQAALDAAEDAIRQIKEVACRPLGCSPGELEVGAGRIFVAEHTERWLSLRDVVYGDSYPNGNSIGGPVVGTGKFIAAGLTGIDPETGEGLSRNGVDPWL
jgi:CO/xanthine dehydrogenase Mo-binding subunit